MKSAESPAVLRLSILALFPNKLPNLPSIPYLP